MVTLTLDGLGAGHGTRTILSGVSVPALRGGELVAVLGPNAAGKSTLFRRIAGLVHGPGQVRLQGARRGAEGICYMPQDSAASPALTVHESVLLARMQGRGFGVGDAELALVERLLAELDLLDIAFRALGELSGGQRQLAAIAQTLARDPEVLLLDEPTSALDLQRQMQVLGCLQRLARRDGLLVLVAMHDLNQALRHADQAIVIAGGTLQASGPVRQVISAGLLRSIWRVEARIESCSRGLPQVVVDGAA
jgi:iron complex transport system ATP-binding protein